MMMRLSLSSALSKRTFESETRSLAKVVAPVENFQSSLSLTKSPPGCWYSLQLVWGFGISLACRFGVSLVCGVGASLICGFGESLGNPAEKENVRHFETKTNPKFQKSSPKKTG